MKWVPPWRSGVAGCGGCGQRVARSTLDDAGECVTCAARSPAPEPVPAEEPQVALFAQDAA